MSSTRLSPQTAFLLTLPPLLWAGNAVVGRLVGPLVPPITLNLLRWLLALVMLWPLAGWVLRPSSGLWPHWRRFAVLGLLGVGLYNTLQYLALQTSTPLNVTLVASSTPLWMLALGRLFFQTSVRRMQLVGTLTSMLGVATVLARGELANLAQLHLVAGDLYILAATFSWALYSWLLTRQVEPAAIRQSWSAMLLAQVVFGVAWSSLFSAAEWAFTPAHIVWGWPLVLALLFIAVGPAVVAYRCWGLGVQRAGPAMAGFFINLTPLFTALLSTAFLGELPKLYHVLAFALIVSGIALSARR